LASYVVENTVFNIWIEGEHAMAIPQLIADFKKFTQSQFDIFKSFPFEEYHFLLILLPYQHYHGVEHHNSTVIVLGPDYNMAKPMLYKELVGISCHELFHAWNALQIKPKELIPYDFTKENYFETGFVLEGFTTYYGDYLLARAGVWTVAQYMHELNAILKREFDNFGSKTSSLSRSSVELWLDGYVQGIPNRKVSIYTKGCLFALLLDLSLRESTNNRLTLDQVMCQLWERFGKSKLGYTPSDIVQLVNEITGQDFNAFFDLTIFSTSPLQSLLHQKLAWVGCQLLCTDSLLNSENYFGFRVVEKEGKCLVDYCESLSEADYYLAKNDEIIAVNGKKVTRNLQDLLANQFTISLTLFRDSALKTIVISQDANRYFKQYAIVPLEKMSDEMQNNFQLWLC
jgi:predicted metalloprotease with PDZ domain